MATNAPSVADLTFQKFIDACIASVRLPSGSAPDAAPSAFKDKLGTTLTVSETSEFKITFRTNPGGMSATMKIEPVGSRAYSISGPVDTTLLASKLV
jgi:hypothetical protein